LDEYTALAQRVVLSLDDVRGCLVLSRDGLVLGAFPEGDEESIKPSWLRFVSVGDARKSFVEFGDQIWAFVNRGPYAAFVVAGPAVRPGVLIDQLEQALLLADEARQKRDTLKVPDAASAPSGKPRTSLHPQERPQPVEAAEVAEVASAHERPAETVETAGTPETGTAEAGSAADQAEGTAPGDAPRDQKGDVGSALGRTPQRLVSSGASADDPDAEEPGEIDRVMLAQEFSGLLQLDKDGDEDNS
jgi:hypothetical protein